MGGCVTSPLGSFGGCPHRSRIPIPAPRTRGGRCGTSGGWSAANPWRVLRGSRGRHGLDGRARRSGPTWSPAPSTTGCARTTPGPCCCWVAAIVVAGVALAYLGIMRHRTMTFVREDATARSAAVLLRHLSRIGAVLPRRLAAGEVATVGGSDIGYTSAGADDDRAGRRRGPRVRGGRRRAVVGLPAAGAVSCCSGVPAIALIVGPLLRRLERAESVYRQQQGELTTRAGDIVAGLRVLAGVGGRDLFARRYAARSQDLLRRGLPGRRGQQLDRRADGRHPRAVPRGRGVAGGPDGGRRRHHRRASWSPSTGTWRRSIVPVWFLLEGSYELIRGRVAARRIIALLTLDPGRRSGRRPGPRARARTARPTCTTRPPD